MNADFRARILRGLAGVALLVPLASALGSSIIPVPLRLFLVALWLLTIVRPPIALLALAALVPFGSILLVALGVSPVRFTEALVLTVVSGALVAPRPRPANSVPSATITVPAALFCTVVAASAAVGLTVMQVGARGWWVFIQRFGLFLSRDYLVAGSSGEFPGVSDAALLLEGIALVFIAASHAGSGRLRTTQVFTVSCVSALAAVGLAMWKQIGDAYAASSSVGEIIRFVARSRSTVHVTDANAAGSYFAMTAILALTMTIWYWRPPTEAERPDRRVLGLWMVVSPFLFAGVWISGSRAAVLACVGAIAFTALIADPFKRRHWRAWQVLLAGVPAALAIAALVLALDPRPEGSRSITGIVGSRAAFIETSVRMIATAPWLGVGIGRYYALSGRFMPQSIYWFFFHENAHNNFLQVGAELGLIGLALFVWFLAAAAVRLGTAAKANPGDRLLIGSIAAVAAFVATWLTSHPLLVPEVAYPFWMLLGVSIGRAGAALQPATLPDRRSVPASRVSSRWMRASAAFAIVILAVSVLPRARRDARALNLADTSFGFYDWEMEDGFRFHWTSRQATFFVPGAARELQVPLRALHLGRNTMATSVYIAVGGRTVDCVMLPDYQWTTVRLRLPRVANAPEFQRIDLITSPAWSLAAAYDGPADVRILGVQAGEATTQ